eukprot:SAG22_NODE_224_length_14744_cov_7.467668_6_plen_113_part_00
MGIPGLLPGLRGIQERVGHQTRVGMYDEQFQGSRVAVDGYVLPHGCPSVLMIPAVGRRPRDSDGRPAPRSEGDRFDFTTGRTIHHYQMAALCSDTNATTVLAAAEGPPKAAS